MTFTINVIDETYVPPDYLMAKTSGGAGVGERARAAGGEQTMTGARRHVFERPRGPVTGFHGREVGGLVQPQKCPRARRLLPARRPLGAGVGPDGDPSADRELLKRRRWEPVPTTGGHHAVVEN